MVDDPLKNYKKTDTVGKLRMDVMYVMDACRRSTNNELASKDIMSDGVVNRSKETKVVTKKKRRGRRGIRTGADTWREPSTGPGRPHTSRAANPCACACATAWECTCLGSSIK